MNVLISGDNCSISRNTFITIQYLDQEDPEFVSLPELLEPLVDVVGVEGVVPDAEEHRACALPQDVVRSDALHKLPGNGADGLEDGIAALARVDLESKSNTLQYYYCTMQNETSRRDF